MVAAVAEVVTTALAVGEAVLMNKVQDDVVQGRVV